MASRPAGTVETLLLFDLLCPVLFDLLASRRKVCGNSVTLCLRLVRAGPRDERRLILWQGRGWCRERCDIHHAVLDLDVVVDRKYATSQTARLCTSLHGEISRARDHVAAV